MVVLYPMDKRARRVTVHRVAKSWTQLKWLSKHAHIHYIHFNENSLRYTLTLAFPGDASGKEPTCQCRKSKRCRFNPWVGKIPWRRAWQPNPVFLLGESPWTEETGGLQSMWWQRVRHDWSDWAHTYKLISGYQHGITEAELGRVVYYYIFLSHRHNRCTHSQEHRY